MKSAIFCIIFCVRMLNGLCTERCRTLVTVDQGWAQSSCSNSTGSLANHTCGSLEDVLSSIMDGRTAHEVGGCILVTVLPGAYVVRRRITITQSVVMCGVGDVSASFQLLPGDAQEALDSTALLQQYHALRFQNVTLVDIRDMAFTSSQGAVVVEGVLVAAVSACSFSSFYQGALDFYDCANVTVSNCTFVNNGPVTVVKGDPYRGHAGGLSLGYYYITSASPVARVSGCVFTNNTSVPPSYDQQTTSQLLQYLKFTGRGGGSSVLMGAPVSVNVAYEDCVFNENLAASYGGGLYSGYSGNHDNTLVVNRTKFLRNATPGGGGGLEVGFASGMFPNTVTSLLVYSCEFTENSAGVGGGMYVFAPGPTAVTGELSNFVHMENCTFTGNVAVHYGAAVGMISMLTFNSRDRIRPMEIRDCTFAFNNGGLGGAVSTVYLPQTFSGRNRFQGNRGRALVVVGTLVIMEGPCVMTFVENDIATDGSALFVTSLGQLQISAGTSFDFKGNMGILGSAIVVETNYIPSFLQKSLGNALCPFIYSNVASIPSEWSGVAMNFTANEALVGPAVYMNTLDICSWSRYSEPFFNLSGVFRWPFINYGLNANRAHSSTSPEWYVETPFRSLSIVSKMVEAYPGETINLVVMAADELGRPTTSTFRILESAEEPPFLQFTPSALTHDNLNNSYIATVLYTEGDTIPTGYRRVLAEPILTVKRSRGDDFQVSFKPCPPGYTHVPSTIGNYGVCICSILTKEVLGCNGTKIFLQSGLWGGQNEGTRDRLVTYPCPNGYCQCSSAGELGGMDENPCVVVYDSSRPDDQCACGRTGPLCGECSNGSISALLNRCERCSPIWAIVIPVLVVFDLAAYVVLILLERPFPTWLYSSVFYIQLLPYLTEHFPLSFNRVHPYLYYVSSGLSFYFVYDFCTFVTSALASYLLRYIPFLLFMVAGSVALKIKSLRKPYHGIWWITVLTYTHTVHTSMSILNCPSIPLEGGDVARWYVSGSVHCFRGWHIPLGITAIFVLVLCVAMVPLPLLYHMHRLQRPYWLCRCIEAASHDFREEYKWWGSVELCRKLAVLTFSVPFPTSEYPAIFVITIFGTATLFLQPYKQRAYVLVEAILLVNVVILVFIRMTQSIQEGLGTVYFTTGSGDCHGNTFSSLATFLTPFYYVPLLVIATPLLIWIVQLTRARLQSREPQIGRPGDLQSLDLQESVMLTSTSKVEIVVSAEGDGTCSSVQYVKRMET